MKLNNIILEEGGVYIIKTFGGVYKTEILELTDTTIYLEYIDQNSNHRISKVDFEYKYTVIEKLSSPSKNINSSNMEILKNPVIILIMLAALISGYFVRSWQVNKTEQGYEIEAREDFMKVEKQLLERIERVDDIAGQPGANFVEEIQFELEFNSHKIRNFEVDVKDSVFIVRYWYKTNDGSYFDGNVTSESVDSLALKVYQKHPDLFGDYQYKKWKAKQKIY